MLGAPAFGSRETGLGEENSVDLELSLRRPHMRVRTLWRIGVVVGLLVGVSVLVGSAKGAPVSGTTAGHRGAAVETIRISTARTVATAVLWWMASFSQKENLKIEIVPAFTFADFQRDLVTGRVDAAVLGYPNAASMADQGVDNVKIVAGAFTASQNLVARTGTEINDWSDLEGKTVGVVPGSYAYIMFLVAAREHRVNLNRVTLTNISPVPAVMLGALSQKQVDALVWVPPILQLAIAQNLAYLPRNINIQDNGGLGGATNGVLVVSSKLFANTQLFTRFLRVYVDTVRNAQRHPDRWAAFASQVAGVDTATARSTIGKGKIRTGFTFKVSRSGLVGAARLGPSFGYTRSDQSGKVLEYVELEPLARLLRVKPSSLLIP
jgi:ABC-type nitrate/sulfonate/bicarbonate transport system substrate-binding protein